jgi:hypothetical protein
MYTHCNTHAANSIGTVLSSSANGLSHATRTLWRHTTVCGCHVTCFLCYAPRCHHWCLDDATVTRHFRAVRFEATWRGLDQTNSSSGTSGGTEYRRIQEVGLWGCKVWLENFMCDMWQWVIAEKSAVKTYCVTPSVCYSTARLGVHNPVRLLWLPCYKYVKTPADRLRRLAWSECKLCKSVTVL